MFVALDWRIRVSAGFFCFFFFNDTATTEIYTLSLHDALPISGAVSVRTRTWIERSASPWSMPTTFTLLERAVPPTITAIEAGPFRNLVWWSGDSAPTVVETRRGDSLVLRGHFPVVNARALHVQVRGSRASLDLQPTDVDGGVRVEIPARASSGDWRLVVGARDGRTAPHEITTIRVN